MSDTSVFGIMLLIVMWLFYIMALVHRRQEKKYAIRRVKEYRFPDSHKVNP